MICLEKFIRQRKVLDVKKPAGNKELCLKTNKKRPCLKQFKQGYFFGYYWCLLKKLGLKTSFLSHTKWFLETFVLFPFFMAITPA
jgi:hypothetical protein